MSCTVQNTLYVNNYTGQNVYLTPIMSAKDETGSPIYDSSGNLSIAKMGSSILCKPNPNSQNPNIISNFYPTYDGFTAKSSDGKYFLTVGRQYSTSPNHTLDLTDGICMISWASFCIKKDDGTYYCTSSDGTEFTGMESNFVSGSGYNGTTFAMSSSEKYYGDSGMRWILIIIVILVIIAAIVAAYFGYKKYKSSSG